MWGRSIGVKPSVDVDVGAGVGADLIVQLHAGSQMLFIVCRCSPCPTIVVGLHFSNDLGSIDIIAVISSSVNWGLPLASSVEKKLGFSMYGDIVSLCCPLRSSATPFVQYFCLNSSGVLNETEEGEDDGVEPTSGFDGGRVGMEMEFSMPSLFGFWFNIAITTMSAMMPTIG